MSQNFFKRIVTSIILLLIFLLINFTQQYVFILSILILGIIICIEANKLILKLILVNSSKKKIFYKNFNFRFLILNLLTFCYIFFIFCYYSFEIHKVEGPTFFFIIFSICFFSDIGGYVMGKLIGGKKLSKISPNKTISGTIGSFIFSIIPLFLFSNFGNINLEPNLNYVLFSFIISLINQLGDLFISFFKRKAKIKDTGTLLPGHGGILDRVDGIIFALPFSYLLLQII